VEDTSPGALGLRHIRVRSYLEAVGLLVAHKVSGFGFRVSGFGFRVSELGFRVQRAWGLGLRVQGLGFSLGFRV